MPLLKKRLFEFKKINATDRRIECLLPVEIGELIKEGKITLKLIETNSKWHGVTNPEDEAIVREELMHEADY